MAPYNPRSVGVGVEIAIARKRVRTAPLGKEPPCISAQFWQKGTVPVRIRFLGHPDMMVHQRLETWA